MRSEIWHNLSTDEVLRKLGTTQSGLSESEARLRQQTYGKNIFPEPEHRGPWFFLLLQFKNPLILFLVIAGIVSWFLGKGTDSFVIFAAALLNVMIGFFQEFQADKTFQKLKRTAKISTVVLRNSTQRVIDAQDLVPGDIIVVGAGDKVPADARLIHASNLRVNESLLTGEWLAVEKNPTVLPQNIPLAERENMLFMGTTLEEGRSIAVATAIGNETEFGRIAKLSGEARRAATPLQEDIGYLAKFISRAATLVILLIFLLGILKGIPAAEMFLVSIAVAVAAVPEGLPAAVSVVLAIGMQRILQRKGLIRQILASETLGRTSVILTDKTGTLTQAKMQVARIFTGHEVIPHDGKKLPSERLDGETGHIFILKIGIFTSEAFIENIESGLEEWTPRGKPTDQAFLLGALQAGLEPAKLFAVSPRIDFLAFNPIRKYSASLHKLQSQKRIYYAGAPEILLERSKNWYDEGRTSPLTDERKKIFLRKMEEFQKEGERMLGVAYKDVTLEKFPKENEVSKLLDNLVYVGIISFHDPIRHDVPEAIKLCQESGIRPIIVTGDHVLTAKAVAERIGLFAHEDEVLEAQQLSQISDEELKQKVHHWKIYARAVPEDKLRIAQAWQVRDEVVAMVGDGVNDAPALKRADIGIALGSGTEVAKEASLLVLLDDSFSTIVRAVEEGRVIFDNIRKLVTYLLATSFTEIILIGGSLLLNLPLPLLAPQILWVNLIVEGTQTFPLAFESKEKDVMSRPPFKRKASLFTKEMIVLIFIVGAITSLYLLGLYYLLSWQQYPLNQIRTVIFLALSVAAIFFVFPLKSLRNPIWHISILKNRIHIIATVISLLLLYLALNMPFLSRLLHLEEIEVGQMIIIFLIGIANLLTIELGKLYFIVRKKA